MKLRALLINPWIYDFAAYNLWACPLGLYRVADFLSAYDIEMEMIDCTAAATIREFGKGRYRREVVDNPAPLAGIPRRYKRYGIGTDDFIRRTTASGPYDFVLVTSLMTYWYPGVQKAIELVRDTLGDVPVLLGGIYATLCSEHAARYSGADYIHAGPVERGILFALSTFGFRPKRRKTSEPRSLLPGSSLPFAPLLTSRGCPFRCSYCASSLLHERFRRCDPASVLREIAWYNALGVNDFSFYDDALLVDPDDHIKPILRGVQAAGLRTRFHTPNGLHARYLDFELAGLMRKTGFRTIRLSLETVDGERLDNTGGKVRQDDIEAAVWNLRAWG
ncbi:MAG TPA: radical SAM protein, partial [Dissulfurispiraceae bacterium]|nr:radical SAM protein [Dissulfurispiraceae bacterium]